MTLPIAVVTTAIWPAGCVALYWSDYRDPRVVVGVLVASVVLPLVLCARGPRGVGPVTSLAGCAAAVGLAVLLGTQLGGPHPMQGYFLNSWAVAVGVVLAFARPPEEPFALALAVTGVTAVFAWPTLHDPLVRHIAPMLVAPAVPATVSAVALAVALRTALSAARRTRERTAAVEERAALTEAVHQERRRRFSRWEVEIVPLLEDLAAGTRSVGDAALVDECGRTARRLRTELATSPESIFEVLLAGVQARLRSRGGELLVHDLDVGHRLRESDRVLLTDRVTGLAGGGEVCVVGLTVLDADDHALVVLAVDGAPAAAARAWGGSLTVDGPRRWWWDAELALDDGPAPGGWARAG